MISVFDIETFGTLVLVQIFSQFPYRDVKLDTCGGDVCIMIDNRPFIVNVPNDFLDRCDQLGVSQLEAANLIIENLKIELKD